MYDYPAYLEKLSGGEPVDNPFLDFMGMRLDEIREGYARFTMAVRPEFMQGAGIMQGGLSVALASETAAHAVMSTLAPGENITTIELKNNFLAPPGKGHLTAEATVFRRGRSIIIADCLVTNDQGRQVSRSSSTFMVIRPAG